MSQLSKSLKKRIQELTASIESHRIELTAYERVLHLELSNENAPGETDFSTPEVELTSSTRKKDLADEPETPARGTKTSMVTEVVKSYGKAGTTPKEIDALFAARGIPRSRNLIYNTLSYLVARKRLQRRDGKYFLVAAKRAAKKTSEKATKKVSARKSVVKVKRRLSPEGLKRIREALKKRWAAKKASEAAAAKPTATKTTAKAS